MIDNTNTIGIRFFGGNYCPFSNRNSMMYNLIVNKLVEKYPNIKCHVHFSENPEDNEHFMKAKCLKIPMVTTLDYQNIDLSPPVPIKSLNDEEPINTFLEYIFNQLETIDPIQSISDSDLQMSEEEREEKFTNTSNKTPYIFIVVILLIIILLFVFIRRKKKN